MNELFADDLTSDLSINPDALYGDDHNHRTL
jgi:hypothetical protein